MFHSGVYAGKYKLGLLGLVYVSSDYSSAYLVGSLVSLAVLVIIYWLVKPVGKIEMKT